MLCLQLKAHPEIYEGYVPMAYSDYLKKMNKYYPYLNFYGFTLKALLKEFHAYTFFFWVDETEVVNGVIMSHCRLRQIRYGQQPNISSLFGNTFVVCLLSFNCVLSGFSEVSRSFEWWSYLVVSHNGLNNIKSP